MRMRSRSCWAHSRPHERLARANPIAVAASTAFGTPIGTTTNLMVLGPGEYRFGDYAKAGAPLVGLFLLACALWVPVVWPF